MEALSPMQFKYTWTNSVGAAAAVIVATAVRRFRSDLSSAVSQNVIVQSVCWIHLSVIPRTLPAAG